MTANINGAPKTNPYTLIYMDPKTDEIFCHPFMSSEEDLYGEEVKDLLLLPAAEMWSEIFEGEPDEEQVRNLASHLKGLAIVYGHPNIEVACEPGLPHNPLLDMFGKPQLRIVN